MIELTESAIEHLRRMLDEKAAPTGTGLRISVEKGGCAGMQYAMSFSEPEPGDQISNHQGVFLIIAAEGVPYLEGCRIDYLDSLHDSGFKIDNPNAARSCGCGTSFEPAKTA